MNATPALQPVDHRPPAEDKWFAILCRVNGLYVTGPAQAGRRPVLVFFDRADADAYAAAENERHPGWMCEAVPLPSSPPNVMGLHENGDPRLIAVRVQLAWLGRTMTMEVRGANAEKQLKHVMDLAIAQLQDVPGEIPEPTAIRVGPKTEMYTCARQPAA